MTVKMEMTLPDPPEGYEYTGEIRRLGKGDLYTVRSRVELWNVHRESLCTFPVLRKVPVYRDFLLKDLGETKPHLRGQWNGSPLVLRDAWVSGIYINPEKTQFRCDIHAHGCVFKNVINVQVAD